MPVLETLGFLIWVNFAPFLAHLMLGERLGVPLDGRLRWTDGEPLFGPHKTVRGLIAGVAAGALAAPLLGLPPTTGALAGLLAIAGDVATSFVKRRLGRTSGQPVFGLDQALEGAAPLATLAPALDLGPGQTLAALALFVPVSHAGSFYLHYVLYRPPVSNYPRIIRATTRLREWRACHVPLARWQTWLNFESYVFHRVLLSHGFRVLGWYGRGVENALAVRLTALDLALPDLPEPFDGYRVLLLTDLHLDGLAPLTDVLIDRVRGVDADLCVIGGDVRMEMYGPMAPALRHLKRLLAHVRAADGIYGVLGNHDCIEMLPEFEAAGVTMLVNEAREIGRGGASLWLVGVDDPHYYRCHDLERAFRDTPAAAFTVFVAHSPELYREAARYGARLYLCGHTHGGQICLPGIGPLFTHSSAPRFTAAGLWHHAGMTGYTSRGAGASGVPLRFNCPGEVVLITLRRERAASAAGPSAP